MKGKASTLEKGQMKICVYEENLCDDEICILDSNGISFEVLSLINNLFQQSDYWDEYRKKMLIIKPYYVKAQIGNYPPPNIEMPGYWDFEIIKELCYQYESEVEEK